MAILIGDLYMKTNILGITRRQGSQISESISVENTLLGDGAHQ